MANGRIYISNIEKNDHIYSVRVFSPSGPQVFYTTDRIILSSGAVYKVHDAPETSVNNIIIQLTHESGEDILLAGWMFIVESSSKFNFSRSTNLLGIESQILSYLTFLNNNFTILDNILPDNLVLLDGFSIDPENSDLLFNGDNIVTTWDAIKDKPTNLAGEHTHNINQITNLSTILDGKANTIHTHVVEDITDLESLASIDHTHEIAQIEELQTTLDLKANILDVNNMLATLNDKANINDVNDLLDTKANLELVEQIQIDLSAGLTDVATLQTDLGNKANSDDILALQSVINVKADMDDVTNGLAEKAAIDHIHDIENVNGLNNSLEEIRNTLLSDYAPQEHKHNSYDIEFLDYYIKWLTTAYNKSVLDNFYEYENVLMYKNMPLTGEIPEGTIFFNTIHTGTADPVTDDVRIFNGDYYISQTDWSIWFCQDDVWSLKGSLLNGMPGEDGNTILSGIGVPDDEIGKQNDYYLNRLNWDMWFKIGSGGGTAWTNLGSIKGPQGTGLTLKGTLESIEQLSSIINQNTGDGYLINDNLYIWTDTSWTNVGQIKGPRGNTIITGIENPIASIGIDQDYYINQTDLTLWFKISDNWTSLGSLIGMPGPKGDTGSGIAIKGILSNVNNLTTIVNPNIGDSYLIEGSLYIWHGSNWVDAGNIKGPAGTKIHITNFYPLESLGEKEDLCIARYDDGKIELFVKNVDTNQWTVLGSLNGKDGTSIILRGELTDVSELDTVPQNLSDHYIIQGHIWSFQLTAEGYKWVDGGSIAGPQGEKGDKGDTGGNTIHTGSIDPTTEGVDGDYYINQTTWHVWFKETGIWVDKNSIKGIDGIDGNTVITGSIDPTTEGVDGDYYINQTTWHIWYKTGGTWVDKGSIKKQETVYHVNVVSTDWVGTEAPYTQSINVTGLIETPIANVDVDFSMLTTYTDEIQTVENWNHIYKKIIIENTITLFAKEKPTIDIPILIVN